MEKQSQTKKSSKSIYEKVLDVMQQVGKVEKSAKKNGMHFNPIEHDQVTKVIRKALIENKLLAIPKYLNQRTIENYFYTECNLTLINVENPREKIEVEGASAFAKIDKYATGNAISYATKYAYLKGFCLETGMDSEDGFPAPKDFVVNRRGLQTKLNAEQSKFMNSGEYQNMSKEEQKTAMANFDKKRKAIDDAQEQGGNHGIEL
jgi:hypothetical protein|tara:strand:+ start:296 stop:910 length:615 start_codon:yes stop_codon:yes gene_type:complete